MTVVNQNLPIPAEYLKSSEKFSIIWNDYVDREENVKSEIVNMIKILEGNGYTRTQAIDKIILDHQHLKGFSRATIYRELPDDMKRKYENSNLIMLPDYSDVSNDTFDEEEEEETEIDDTTTTTNEIKFRTEDVTDKVMEMLRLDSIAMKQRMNDEIRRNKILEQLPKDVAEKVKESRLSTDKLEMLLTKNIKQHPELQKTLIDKIKDTKRIIEEVKISDNKAREIVEQTNRDIETGAIQKVGKTYMRYDELSEKLDDQIVKTPNQRYLDIIKSVHKLCESLTGKKLDTSNWKYTEDHFKYTKEYRQEILRENRDKRSLIALNNQLVLIADYSDDFIKMIDESLKDMDNKPDLTE